MGGSADFYHPSGCRRTCWPRTPGVHSRCMIGGQLLVAITVLLFFCSALGRPSCTLLTSFSIPSIARRAFRRGKSKPSSSVALLNLDSQSGYSASPGSTKISDGTGAATKPRPPRLAVELIEHITDFLFELKYPIIDSMGDATIHYAKPSWKDVNGFMEASVELHRMGFSRWLRFITVKEPDDWTVIAKNSHLISEIKCFDNSLLDPRNQQILSKIPHLHAATIDAHNDVWHDANHRFAYRDVIVALPPSLRRLEITHAHGPDIKVIATVKKYCPQIEELRLGRCTMFNRMPACDFWASFPHDHDAYISNIGTDEYAHSLGQELSPLTNLHSLRMGLYLVPSGIVLAHRLFHRQGRTTPATIDWQTAIPLAELPVNPFIEALEPVDPATTDQLVSVLHQPDSELSEPFDCPQCVEATAEISRNAEMSASTILHSYVPSLSKVQWMGWLTPGHLGVRSFELPLKPGL